MHFTKVAPLLLFLLLVQELKSEEFSREETTSDLVKNVDSIKNQIKKIKSEVNEKYENEKFMWQLQVFENWYQDQGLQNCPQDLSYVFNGWTVIERRLDGSENFYRNWSDYKQGFGNKNREFFLGLEPLHQLIIEKGPQELLIILGDHDKQIAYAKYDSFVVGSEQESYELKELGTYSGTAGDAFAEQVGQKFTTLDRDNDNSKLHNCAKLWHGAWWFGYCHQRLVLRCIHFKLFEIKITFPLLLVI